MTTLLTAGGRLTKVRGPRQGQYLNNYQPGAVWSDGSWHDGDAPDEPARVPYEMVVEMQPVVWAAREKLVRTFASVPLKLYELLDDGDRLRIRPGMSHRGANLSRILERPSPRRGATHLKQWIMSPATTFGNSILAKFRPDSQAPPTELIPLDWRYVSAYAQQGDEVEWWGTTQLGGNERYIPVEESLHFAWQPPVSGGIGVSPLAPLARTLRLDDAMVRSQTSAFRDGLQMGGLVAPPPEAKWDEAAINRYRQALTEKHGGVDRAGRLGIMPPGAQFHPRSISAVDMQMMQARIFTREEVCIVYDVKPPILGDLRDMNYAGLVELNRDFHKTTMRPWYSMVEDTINAQLIAPEPEWEGLFVEFDLSEVMRGDPLQEMEVLSTAIEHALASPNEGRKVLNMPRSDNPAADALYLPTNNLRVIGTPPDNDPTAPHPGALAGTGSPAEPPSLA